MAEDGGIQIYNPDKELAQEITLETIKRHRDYMNQSGTGELKDKPLHEIPDNNRIFNKVKALNLIIHTQKQMINFSRPIIKSNMEIKWRKKYKTEDERKKNPFEKCDNNYKSLMDSLELLRACEMDILEAEKSKTLRDDFMLKKETNEGEVFELTSNFYEMIKELEDNYELIYSLMLYNKIVSSGLHEDEEMTYKQKEEEMIKRIGEA